MSEAVPTPFDILPPASAPYAPGWQEWACLATAVLVGFVLIRMLSKRRRASSSRLDIIIRAQRELQGLLASPHGETMIQSEIVQASLLLRRMLSALLGTSIDTLTASELARLRDSQADSNIKTLLTSLHEVHDLRFLPAGAAVAPRSWLRSVVHQLDLYRSAEESRGKR